MTKDRLSCAIADVIAERRRQIEAEGWTAEHDDAHKTGTLSAAGAAYALHMALRHEAVAFGLIYETGSPPTYWPFSTRWWKPKNPRRDLVRAAALIIAEIERLDRAQAKGLN